MTWLKNLWASWDRAKVQPLPLREFPDLWLGVAGRHADFGEDHHSLLELRHRLFAAAGRLEQVRQVVAQRRLAMAIAQCNAQRQRLLSVEESLFRSGKSMSDDDLAAVQAYLKTLPG